VTELGESILHWNRPGDAMGGSTGPGDLGATDGSAARVHPDQTASRILVVEDNPVNLKVVIRMLARLGYRADAVGNGVEAIEAVSRVAYAAVLMDCEMPEMDGYEATRQIRQAEPAGHHLPIIAVTALAQPWDLDRCLAAGMDDYLTKPVRTYALAATLDRWIRTAAC
jgi:CheY-like chemotaxis protein